MTASVRDDRRVQRQQRAVAASLRLLVGSALSLVVAGCSGGEESGAPTTEAPYVTMQVDTAQGCDLVALDVGEPLPPGFVPAASPTIAPGVDTGYEGEGQGSGNPYLVPGARPVPGPDMPRTTLGAEPLTVAVAVPPNPDVGTPAVTPDGLTTLPRSETTLPPVASEAATPTSGTVTTTSALMALAEDPGCVSMPGEP